MEVLEEIQEETMEVFSLMLNIYVQNYKGMNRIFLKIVERIPKIN